MKKKIFALSRKKKHKNTQKDGYFLDSSFNKNNLANSTTQKIIGEITNVHGFHHFKQYNPRFFFLNIIALIHCFQQHNLNFKKTKL